MFRSEKHLIHISTQATSSNLLLPPFGEWVFSSSTSEKIHTTILSYWRKYSTDYLQMFSWLLILDHQNCPFNFTNEMDNKELISHTSQSLLNLMSVYNIFGTENVIPYLDLEGQWEGGGGGYGKKNENMPLVMSWQPVLIFLSLALIFLYFLTFFQLIKFGWLIWMRQIQEVVL